MGISILRGFLTKIKLAYKSQEQEPVLVEEGIEVLVEEEQKRRQESRITVVYLTLAHVSDLRSII